MGVLDEIKAISAQLGLGFGLSLAITLAINITILEQKYNLHILIGDCSFDCCPIAVLFWPKKQIGIYIRNIFLYTFLRNLLAKNFS